jgi:DNA helicase-2/ATP-dependent DNA helicase PcrA
MVGGIGFFSLDSGAVDGSENHQPLSFSDFAVLYRTRRQGELLFKTLVKAGIPCQLIDKNQIFDDPGIASLISAMKVLWGKGVFSDLQTAMGIAQPASIISGF